MSIKCEERFFESTDRKDRVRYLTWIDDSVETKGVALIAHGVCEHIDRFHGIGEHLAKAGYAVYGEAHVGHGKTAMGEEQNLRNIGKCPKGADKIVIKDMHKMRDIAVSEHPGLPEVLVGHSMGSFVAKIYGATYGKELAATVYCGSGDFFGNPFRLLIYPLVPLFTAAPVKDLEIKVTNNMFSTGWLSRSKENRADYLKDPMITVYYTPGLLAMLGALAARSAGTLWPRKMPKDLPVLVVAGTQDIIGFCGIGVKFADRWMDKAGIKDHTTKWYKSYRHELFRDDCKEEVYNDITDWLKSKGLPG